MASIYRPLEARRTCIAEAVLICFDNPDPCLRDKVLSKARAALEKLCSTHPDECLCPSFTPEKSLRLYTDSDIL